MRLTEPEHFGRSRSRAGQGGGIGILSGALLVLLGALLTVVVGVLAGIVPPAQLVSLLAGGEPPAPAPPPMPSVEVAAPAPAAPAALPSDEQVRVVRDETFGDWRFVCVEAKEAAAASCSVSQQLRVAETGAAVFVWRIFQDGKGGLVGLWQVPETVQRAAGLTVDAGTPSPIGIPFDSCGGGSCRALANLAPDFVAGLSSAETLSASVTLANSQPLKFPLSANGLAEALAALSQ